MKKFSTYLLLILALLTAGCSDYDDTKVVNRIDELEERLQSLEELCKQANTNMVSLQALIVAVQRNDTITGITAITKDGEVVGYTITFAKGGPITIYNSDAATSGQVPQIGVKEDADGNFYWTLGGEWMLDAEGNKITVEEKEAAPRFKVEEGYWYVSYDNGASWEQLGPATDGSTGSSESIFADVDTSRDGFIIFTLLDGSKISVPTSQDHSYIDFLDNTAELLCIMNWDTNGDDKLSYEEAAAVESIGNVFQGTNIISFNEFKHFTSVKRIEQQAFRGCKQLRRITLPENLEEIGTWAFYETSALNELFIPASVSLIEDMPIEYCFAMSKLTVAEDNDVYDSRNGCNAIIHTETNRLIAGCNTTVIPDGIRTIAAAAFGASRIETVNIPNSVSVIEDVAFHRCDNLKTVTIGNGVKEWGEQAFLYASGDYVINSDIPDSQSQNDSPFGYSYIGNLTFGPDVTTVGTSAFASCGRLQKVVIPKNVVALNNSFPNSTMSELEYNSPIVFSNLFNGKKLLKVTLGEDVETIQDAAFEKCSSLAEVVTGDKITSIGNSAFSGCSNLANFEWSASLESIGDYAFANGNKLTVVELPSSVTNLGVRAFSECKLLQKVTLSDNIEEIKEYTFYKCTALEDVHFPTALKKVGQFAFEYSGLKSAVLPEQLTQIESAAFKNCSSLEKVVLNSTIEEFTWGVFAYGSPLAELTINAPLRPSEYDTASGAIDTGLFKDCNFKKVIIGENIKSIPNGTFSQCKYLEEVILPEGFESICPFAFDNCTVLREIDLPSTLSTIGYSAFRDSGLESIVVPEGITILYPYTFSGCKSLTSVSLPESLIEIGRNAFEVCNALREMRIPKNVTKIGQSIVYECNSGMSMYFEGTEPPVLEGNLGIYPADVWRVYVPTASLEKYQSAWYKYSSLVSRIYSYDI